VIELAAAAARGEHLWRAAVAVIVAAGRHVALPARSPVQLRWVVPAGLPALIAGDAWPHRPAENLAVDRHRAALVAVRCSPNRLVSLPRSAAARARIMAVRPGHGRGSPAGVSVCQVSLRPPRRGWRVGGRDARARRVAPMASARAGALRRSGGCAAAQSGAAAWCAAAPCGAVAHRGAPAWSRYTGHLAGLGCRLIGVGLRRCGSARCALPAPGPAQVCRLCDRLAYEALPERVHAQSSGAAGARRTGLHAAAGCLTLILPP
jgi:hypothetical protein